MAGEIVGTAFVRIKAITKGLGKDIKKSVEKGMADAKLDKVGEDGGKQLGTALGDSTVDSASDRIKERSGDFIPDEVLKDVRKKFDKDGGLLGDFDLIPKDAEDRLKDSLNRQVSTFHDGFERINSNIDKAWPKDRDLFPSLRKGWDDLDRDSESWSRRFRKTWKDAEKDSNAFANSLDKIQAKLKGFDTPGLGGGITKVLGGVVGLAVAALPYIQDLGAGILAYATGIVAQIGFMSTAVVGLAAAAGAAVGSSLLPIIPIMLAFKSETEALIEFKDALKATSEEFLRIGTATQATLLPGLDQAAFKLTELVPMLSEFGFFVGNAVANFAELAATILTSEAAQGRLSDILRSSLRIFDVLLVTLVNVGDILSGIWVAAIPSSEKFVGTLSDMVNRWREIINFGLYTGTLTDTLNTWYDRAELLGSALGDVAGALFDILSVGADSSDSVFVRFDEWAERFRDWTESEVGQNKLALIFENSLAIMREVNGVAVELFDGIFGRLDDIGGADSMVESLQRFQELLPGIKEEVQGFIDQIRDINSVVGPQLKNKILLAFEELKEPIGRFVYAILDVMGAMEESGAFETFLDLLKILAEVLTTIVSIPGFGTFVGYMIAFGGAAKVAAVAIGPLVSVLGPLVGVVKGIAAAKAGTALATTASGLSSLATASSGAGGIGALLKTVGGGLLPIGPWGAAAAIGVAAVGTAFYLHTKDAREFKQEVRQVTDALGLLNGGLNVTAEGFAKYIEESSDFASKDQLDILANMGFSIEGLSRELLKGTIGYEEFAEAAIAAGEIETVITGQMSKNWGEVEVVNSSLADLTKQYGLTSEEAEKLARGEKVVTDSHSLMMSNIKGSSGVLGSLTKSLEALGQSAKDNINTFITNAQNVRLLGSDSLSKFAADLKSLDNEDAGLRMASKLRELGEVALKDSESLNGLTDSIRDQVAAQVEHLTGTERIIAENALLYAEQQKVYEQIRQNFTLFNSAEFKAQFGEARREVFEFSEAVRNINWGDFQFAAAFGDLETLRTSFPEIGGAASELFEVLRGLPEEEFNAAAAVMNADAGSLRDAMNGAQQAIIDLQETALDKLPSIQTALDQNLKTREDGSQYFDTAGFTASATDRINKTNDFASDIQKIFNESGAEAARLALEQGPETANALAEALSTNPHQVQELLAKMEAAEASLSAKVEELFGDAVAAEYFAAVKPVGDAMGIGLTAGLSSPATLEALATGGTALLNSMVQGFQGHFVWDGLSLKFVNTGQFRSAQTQLSRLYKPGGGGLTLSGGGFVGNIPFGSGPKGTDTIPAWLTPGEFVIRRSVAQAIPASILNSLNSGNSHMISLLSSLDRSRPGTASSVGSLSSLPPVQASRGGSGNVIIQQMNIEAPTPYETSRQVANRLRILQSQMTQG